MIKRTNLWLILAMAILGLCATSCDDDDDNPTGSGGSEVFSADVSGDLAITSFAASSVEYVLINEVHTIVGNAGTNSITVTFDNPTVGEVNIGEGVTMLLVVDGQTHSSISTGTVNVTEVTDSKISGTFDNVEVVFGFGTETAQTATLTNGQFSVDK